MSQEAKSSSLQKLHFFSTDSEFSRYQIALEPKDDKTSAPSANETRDVLCIPQDDALEKHNALMKDTVKQGATVANTLAEVAAQIRLRKVRENQDSKDSKDSKVALDNPRYAKSFLVTELNAIGQRYATAEDFIKHLFAASRWQPNLGHTMNACRLFGFQKRPKAAGTFHPELFEDIRRLNAECGLGLEQVFHATALIGDFDFHTDNYMLNFDISKLDHTKQDEARQLIAKLKSFFDPVTKELKFDEETKESKSDEEAKENKSEQATVPQSKRERHYARMAATIKSIQALGAHVYFHKIDHDSGFYRYCDDDRELSFRDHSTSMTRVNGLEVRTQPTNHLAELLVGAAPERFVLSATAQAAVRANPINQQLDDSVAAMEEFFGAITNQCKAGMSNDSEALRAEYMLLCHFYQHIVSGSKESVFARHARTITNEGWNYNIGRMQRMILDAISKATVRRGIALHSEYLEFVEDSKAMSGESSQFDGFKRFLAQDKDEGVILSLRLHQQAIVKLVQNRPWYSFLSQDEISKEKELLAVLEGLSSFEYAADKKGGDLLYAQSTVRTEDDAVDNQSSSATQTLDVQTKQLAEQQQLQRSLLDYLSEKRNRDDRFYKIISQQIGERSMPLYQKSQAKRFREGLVGFAGRAFWFGIGLMGAVAIGAAVTALAVVTFGAAVPLALPAVGSILAGVGMGTATAAAATNPAAQRWFRKTSLFKKMAFFIGVAVVLAAATVLTGGAALALVGTMTVVAGVATLIGVKAAAASIGAGAAVAKGVVAVVGAAEGAGLVAQAVRSESTRNIVQRLDVDPTNLRPYAISGGSMEDDLSRPNSPESTLLTQASESTFLTQASESTLTIEPMPGSPPQNPQI